MGLLQLIPEAERRSILRYTIRCAFMMLTGRWVIKGISSTTDNAEQVHSKLQTEWGTVRNRD